MRVIVPFIMVGVLAISGCDRTKALTPEQTKQIEAARSATVASSERMLGRPLTESEKECVHVDFQDDKIVGTVSSPLCDTLKQRKAEMLGNTTEPSNAAAGMTRYQYLASDGGPHMLLPVDAAKKWSGVSSPLSVQDPKSDYGRACAAGN